ncbi:MAG: hypothetical protein ACFFDR_13215, partial [Candidatus Thorarchaeota archaeon]
MQEDIIELLERYDLRVLSSRLEVDPTNMSDLSIIFSHESYQNFEAHLFTIADACGWYPHLLHSGDVEVLCNVPPSESEKAIRRFLDATRELMLQLQRYRERIALGEIPSFIWAHHEFRWHRFDWDSAKWGSLPSEDYLQYVDSSIRSHILRLNELGFVTKESCSGLPEEHTDRDPYWPYIMFEERAYPGIAPHLFTLSDIALWDAKYAPHNFDVYLKAPRGVATLDSFCNLVNCATGLYRHLHEHSQKVTTVNLSPLTWRMKSYSVEK